MLYKHKNEETLDASLFRDPSSEYRGAPFWSWNNQLEGPELERQIAIFKEMGFGGFQMHVRTGLKNQYLGPEFMEMVRLCVDKAREEGLHAWIYDEDQWPSGYGGGMVTKDPAYRARRLQWTVHRPEAMLACFDVVLDADGRLKNYVRVSPEAEPLPGSTRWYAAVRINEPSARFNGQTYADTLNPDATRRFIEVTHERYRQTVGDEFNRTVPAIFTDEPGLSARQTLSSSFSCEDLYFPWTDSLPALYRERYQEELLDVWPELVWELPAGVSVHRYRYHNLVSDQFASAFAGVIAAWCRQNGLPFTGHMVDEDSLQGQGTTVGEVMRSYPYMDIPGIDILCGEHAFTTAKQAQSCVRQYGREGMLAELYGVTGWDADFREYKHQGDWLAALGVTVRVPHLAWYAMEGEAKRDYPASIFYQSSWYREFPALEDHYARLNTALTRGHARTRIAVIHPIESYWLLKGPAEHCAAAAQELDENFHTLTEWLIANNLDFDFISEALLPGQCPKGSAPLQVGAMAYDVVLVSGCRTLRRSTLERLSAFQNAGGRLLFLGGKPEWIDAQPPTDEERRFLNEMPLLPFSRMALINALDSYRDFWLRNEDGSPCQSYVAQLRQDGADRWLFLVPLAPPSNKDVDAGRPLTILISGHYRPECYDTQTGTVRPYHYGRATRGGFEQDAAGRTILHEFLYGYDSLLLRLTPWEGASAPAEDQPAPASASPTAQEWTEELSYSLAEPNVLLLDMAEYKLDGDTDFAPREEILRLDNLCRSRLGLRQRPSQQTQPWAMPPEEIRHHVTLRFEIESDIPMTENLWLAMEHPETARICLNGTPVSSETNGFYVDIALHKLPLPALQKGRNILEVTLPFGERYVLENLYLLGDFGVQVRGSRARLTALPRTVVFGNLAEQGFPFYGGIFTYHLPFRGTGRAMQIASTYFRGALITAAIDGKPAGRILYSPYTLTLPALPDGEEHTLSLSLYPSRYNTFGSVHLCDETRLWYGPGAWRSQGASWSYEYCLHRSGILKSPVLFR